MDMEWPDRMNPAIDYIENNIDDEIDIYEAVKIACCSSFHFQRMFFAIIGITPAGYIRRRRSTLAATEPAVGNDKIIDIALKYGHERDSQKPDIAAYFPVAFLSAKGMGVRCWIPFTKKK